MDEGGLAARRGKEGKGELCAVLSCVQGTQEINWLLEGSDSHSRHFILVKQVNLKLQKERFWLQVRETFSQKTIAQD